MSMLAVLNDADRSNGKREQVCQTLKSQGVEFLLARFVDIHGTPKVKQVPMDCFDDLVDSGAGFAGGAVWGLGQGPESHDMMARSDLDTFV